MTEPTPELPGAQPAPGPTSPGPTPPAFDARTIGALAAFTGLALFLDGLPGASAGVIVAAVLLARLPLRTIGAIGVACLGAVPLVVAGGGIPTAADLAPAFVGRSLWPHHLTFVGLALVSAWVVISVVAGPEAHGHPSGPEVTAAEEGPEPAIASAPLGLRVALVAVVALAALGACVAVVVA